MCVCVRERGGGGKEKGRRRRRRGKRKGEGGRRWKNEKETLTGRSVAFKYVRCRLRGIKHFSNGIIFVID